MKIDYILSDTTKKATTKALEAVVKKAEADKFSSVIVLVPETKSIIIEKEMLSLCKNGATANIFVYSFVRLISRMGGIKSENVISKQTCIVFIRKIIFDNIDKFVCYKKTAKSLGFAEKIYDTIAQLKSSNVSPQDLEDSLSNFSEALRLKLSDILLIYKEYQNRLSGELFDDCDRLALISKFAKSNKLINESDVFVVGFDNITFEMEDVLKDIATHSKSITFSSVYFNSKRKDFYIQKNELYLKFKHIADSLKYAYVPSFYKTFESGDFYNIANYLFSMENKKFEPKGNVKVFEAQNKKQELEFVATNIIEEIRSGKRFKDIGVFACGLEENYKDIENTFKRYNIPYFINRKHKLSNHFFVKFIEGAFALYFGHLSVNDVLNFVSNPLFCEDDLSEFYNIVKASGINYGGFLSEIKYEFKNEQDEQIFSKVLNKLKLFYLAFEQRLSSSKTINDFVKLCEFIIDSFDIKNKLSYLSQRQEELNQIIDAKLTQAILEKHSNFSAMLCEFMGELCVESNEFLQIYLSGFSEIKLNLSPVSIDCVIVQDNTDGFFDIKDLFVFDAVDGQFPFKLGDTGIILDSELDEAKNLIKKSVEPTVSTINARENFRAYEALLEPKEKLFVSYSLKSESGSANKPAQIISSLIELFQGKVLCKKVDACGYVTKTNAELEFAESVGKFLKDGQNLTDVNKKYSEVNLSENYKQFIENLSFSKKNFEIENADKLYFYENTTSVSQLENYFGCPYQFFANYGLRLKENKDSKISNLDIGNIVHRVVELFAKDIKSFFELDEVNFDKGIEKLLNVALTEQKVNVSKNKAVINLVLLECKKLCKNILEEQNGSGFKISKLEFDFGKISPIEIELNSGKKLSLVGKIDRIDKMGEFVRIVDYKTGDVKNNLSGIYYGKKIQLASYLSATKKLGKTKPAGLFYLPVHSDFEEDKDGYLSHYKMQGFLLDDIDVIKHFDSSLSATTACSNFVPLKVREDKNGQLQINKQGRVGERFLSSTDFDNIEDYVLLLIKVGAEEILSGYIEPSPLSMTASGGLERCETCKYAGYCGLEHSSFSGGRHCISQVNSGSFDMSNKDSINKGGI